MWLKWSQKPSWGDKLGWFDDPTEHGGHGFRYAEPTSHRKLLRMSTASSGPKNNNLSIPIENQSELFSSSAILVYPLQLSGVCSPSLSGSNPYQPGPSYGFFLWNDSYSSSVARLWICCKTRRDTLDYDRCCINNVHQNWTSVSC